MASLEAKVCRLPCHVYSSRCGASTPANLRAAAAFPDRLSDEGHNESPSSTDRLCRHPAQRVILSSSVRGSSAHKDSLPSAAGAAQRSNSGQKSSILGRSAAVVHARSINILVSTTSPTNTKKQTTSRPSSMASRRRPLPSEPGATRSRRRVREFHTRSLRNMDTVLSIRNVACPKLDLAARPASRAFIVPRAVDRKFQQMRQQRLRRPGISPEATLGDEAFRARALALPPLR